MNSDPLDRLAAYAPTPTSVAGEWGPQERDRRLSELLDTHAGPDAGSPRRLHVVPPSGVLRSRAVAPIAASVAVLALAGGVAVVAGQGSDGSNPAGNGAAAAISATGIATGAPGGDIYRASVRTPRLGAHQWAYRAISAYSTTPNSGSATEKSASWVAADGSGARLDPAEKADGAATCSTVAATTGTSFDDPTQPFVDALPTDPDDLKAYLVRRVSGSTSQEEAVFTAVGDLLRTGDLLASSEQRAAMVTVLVGLRRTSVHLDTDESGRSAVRVDFTDPGQRGGEIQSLYFDRRTYQLLEERDSTTGAQPPDDAPSAPYTSVPSAQPTTAQHLTGTGPVSIVTAERVVDTLPAKCGQK